MPQFINVKNDFKPVVQISSNNTLTATNVDGKEYKIGDKVKVNGSAMSTISKKLPYSIK